jgi:hypothetical protein
LALAPVAPAASLPKAVDFWGMQPDALAATCGCRVKAFPLNEGPRSVVPVSAPGRTGQSISWKRYPATLGFSTPLSFATRLGAGPDRSALVVTRLTVSFSGAVPAHWRQSASFTLKKLSKGFYGFALPS